MSAHSIEATGLLAAGKIDEASRMAIRAVEDSPDDWHAHYAIGLCFRFANDLDQACVALGRAHQLNPREKSVLLALAIATQLKGDYPESIQAIKSALEIDPNFFLAYNTLGMTQKLMGEYEKAAHNYDAGAKALARTIVEGMKNRADTPRVPNVYTRHNLWMEYALFGGVYLCAAADPPINHIATPSGDMAARDERTREFRGWYWEDRTSPEKGKTRIFLPNYFNTFQANLRNDPTYANFMGNRSTVLRLLGREEEANRHLDEARDFGGSQQFLSVG